MPKLPGYDSRRQLTTQQPQFLRTGAGEKGVADIITKGIGKVADITDKWRKAVNTIQTTVSKSNYSSGALDLLNRAANEIDYNKFGDYLKENKQLRDNSLKGFSDKVVENQVAIDLDYESQQVTIKLENIFKKKTIEAGQVSAFKLINDEINNPTPESPEKIKSIIDVQIAAGIFGRKEGYKLYEDSVKDAKYNYFLSQFRQDPVQAEKDLMADKFKLDLQTKERAIKHLTQLKQMIKDSQDTNAHDATLKLLSGDLTFEEIDILEKTPDVMEKIPLSDGEALRKALIGQVKTDAKAVMKNVKKSESYFKFIDQFVDDKIDQAKFRLKLIDVFKDGIINPDEGKFLANLKQNLSHIKIDRHNDIVKGAIGNMRSWLGMQPLLTEGEAALKLQQLLGEMAGGADPDETSDKIKKETLKEKNNWINNVPETGMVLIDKNSKKVRVFPDGHIEDVK